LLIAAAAIVVGAAIGTSSATQSAASVAGSPMN
jgi:hypothetical protein